MSDTARSTERTGSGERPGVGEHEGIALSAAAGVDAKALTDAWAMVVGAAARQPAALFQAYTGFWRDCASILFGSSDLAPTAGDARFRDAAWADNPLYRRIGQSYLAWTRALDTWLEKSELAGMDRERARFLLDAAKDVLAPMNTLAGNPEALAKATETRGASLTSGFRNFVDDLRHNHGYPAVADRDAFQLGRDVAATPGAVVFRNEVFELMQYAPTTEAVRPTPFLYIFSQVNRFYLGDLTPDRSLFGRLLDAGIPVYAMSWRNPKPEHRHWNLGTYAGATIEAIEAIREISGSEQVDVMGLCAGGLVAAAAAGVLEARNEDRIRSLSLVVSILDNQPGDSDFGLFVSERSVEAQKAMVRAKGLFAEKDVFEMFAMLRIEESVMSFLRSNYLLGEAPPKHPLLFWSMDYTRVPAEMQCDFLDLSWRNDLARGELELLGERIDLGKLSYPVYVLAGSTDHITPWKGCYRSTQLFDGDVRFVLTNQNHTQTICARTDNRHLRYWVGDTLPQDAEAWSAGAAEHPGSWTTDWIEWLRHGSDETVPAPEALGNAEYPVLDAAPGQFVRT